MAQSSKEQLPSLFLSLPNAQTADDAGELFRFVTSNHTPEVQRALLKLLLSLKDAAFLSPLRSRQFMLPLKSKVTVVEDKSRSSVATFELLLNSVPATNIKAVFDAMANMDVELFGSMAQELMKQPLFVEYYKSFVDAAQQSAPVEIGPFIKQIKQTKQARGARNATRLKGSRSLYKSVPTSNPLGNKWDQYDVFNELVDDDMPPLVLILVSGVIVLYVLFQQEIDELLFGARAR